MDYFRFFSTASEYWYCLLLHVLVKVEIGNPLNGLNRKCDHDFFFNLRILCQVTSCSFGKQSRSKGKEKKSQSEMIGSSLKVTKLCMTMEGRVPSRLSLNTIVTGSPEKLTKNVHIAHLQYPG